MEFGFFRGQEAVLRHGPAVIDLKGGLQLSVPGAAPIELRPHLEASAAGDAATSARLLPGFCRPLPADEGPEHAAARVALRLFTPGGDYAGDGVWELAALPGDAVFLGIGLRLLPAPGSGHVRLAGLELGTAGRARLAAASPRPEGPGDARLPEGPGWVVFESGGLAFGLGWGREAQGWCEALGGEGLWPAIGDGRTAPFFHGWENHLRQWGEPRGWRARETAALVLGEGSATLAWHRGAGLPVGAGLHFSGAAVLAWGAGAAEVREKLAAPAAPVTPQAEGAAVSGFDCLEGSYRFRRTGGSCRITLPADPLARRTLVRVDGPPAAAVACTVNGAAARPQLVSVGRVDDPYGPHEGRPDSGGRPVLAQFERPAERVELGVRLSRERPTTVEVREAEGLSLSYLAQDDRRELLLFSHLDPRPLGRLSLADLKLRELRLPGRERPALSLLPLYWFLMNAPSPWHSANRLEGWELAENGPGAVRLTLSALNPGGAVRSTVKLALRLPPAGELRAEVDARLEVLADFPVPHFQFCNLFPEPSRMPGDWGHAETLAMTGERLWVVENRKPAGAASTVEGERFRDFRAPFFLSQYASPGGNFAMLVTGAEPAGTGLGYELCRCWLDNHLFVTFPEGRPRPGSRYRVRYQLALWGGGGTAREEVRNLAEASLRSGQLEV